MEPHDPGAYGRQTAADYDAVLGEWPDTEDAVACVAQLAGGGAVLEFGIGTGRLALPLRARGLEVAGIEGSPEMVERLRSKPGGEALSVVVGDFAQTRVEGRFAVVVLAVNTVFALPSQDAQIDCFRNAAQHLQPGGTFVIEAFMLSPSVASGERGLEVRRMNDHQVELQVSEYDAERHQIRRVLVNLASNQIRVHSVNDQYASPGELDLMARMAGMRLCSRWSSWTGEPVVAGSRRHVSIYQLA